MAYNSDMFKGGLSSILSGILGNSGNSYNKYMNEIQKYHNQAQNAQQPYINAGTQGLDNYQNWLNTQKDPAAFVNNLTSNYQQNPYTSYLQGQAQNAGINAGSKNGTMGSSALMQQMQQNSANIGQQGMDSWLKNVLGINTQYGEGQNNLMQGGHNAANTSSALYSNFGNNMGEAAYEKQNANQYDRNNTMAGLAEILSSLGLF